MKTDMNAPKVSVIMPAYNCEKYVGNSALSVLGQTYENLELIIVNDGSADSTRVRIEELANRDKRVTAVNVENGGPAAARNTGIKRAEGDYIMFLDADDLLLPDALEKAVCAAENGADMVVFGFTIENPDKTSADYCEERQTVVSENFAESFPRLYKANLLNQVWAKLYKSDLINNNGITFPDYRWGEDRLFVFDCIEKADKIEVLPFCGYRYIMHEGESLITGFYAKKLQASIEIDERIESICTLRGVGNEEDFRYMFVKSVFSCITNLFTPSCRLSYGEKRKYIAALLQNERVTNRSRGSISGGIPVKVLRAVMLSGNITLNFFVFKMVAFTGKIAPGLFLRLKHRK